VVLFIDENESKVLIGYTIFFGKEAAGDVGVGSTED
jgi:hypothetical protein